MKSLTNEARLDCSVIVVREGVEDAAPLHFIGLVYDALHYTHHLVVAELVSGITCAKDHNSSQLCFTHRSCFSVKDLPSNTVAMDSIPHSGSVVCMSLTSKDLFVSQPSWEHAHN